ncbi:MAG: hypothetical protein RI993_1690 [Pseudomonadota bacterium]
MQTIINVDDQLFMHVKLQAIKQECTSSQRIPLYHSLNQFSTFKSGIREHSRSFAVTTIKSNEKA